MRQKSKIAPRASLSEKEQPAAPLTVSAVRAKNARRRAIVIFLIGVVVGAMLMGGWAESTGNTAETNIFNIFSPTFNINYENPKK